MSPDATDQSAAQRADQKGNDLEPNPRPDGFHRADVRSLHEGPGFLQGVTPVGHHAPFSGSDDISNLQAHCCRCKAGKRVAIGQGKGAALIAVGCRPASGCVGRVGGSGHWRSAAGYCCWRKGWRWASPMPISRGVAEAAAGAVVHPGRHDQRLESGAELRRGGGAVEISCALTSDPLAKG
jgi:hypothetical protein